MTKKFNVDEQTQLAEILEITLEGKVYTVNKITTDIMTKATEIGKNKEDIEAPIKQLALLVGVDYVELKKIDIRKIGKAIEFITGSVRESIEIKNPSGAEAKPRS
jgi:hypothetical protein